MRLVPGVADEQRARALVAAIGRMLRTPANPPLLPPGAGDEQDAFFDMFEREILSDYR